MFNPKQSICFMTGQKKEATYICKSYRLWNFIHLTEGVWGRHQVYFRHFTKEHFPGQTIPFKMGYTLKRVKFAYLEQEK